jgi:transposase-like protein
MGAKKMAKRGRKPCSDLSKVACPNPNCPDFNQPGAPGLVANGTYLTQSGQGHRYRCRTCGQSFCARSGSAFHDLRTPEEKIITALKLLVKGVTIRRTAELLGTQPAVIRAWLSRGAQHREVFKARLLDEPGITETQVDELWQALDQNQLRHRATLWRQRRGWRT